MNSTFSINFKMLAYFSSLIFISKLHETNKTVSLQVHLNAVKILIIFLVFNIELVSINEKKKKLHSKFLPF